MSVSNLGWRIPNMVLFATVSLSSFMLLLFLIPYCLNSIYRDYTEPLLVWGWLGSRVVSVLDSGAVGLGSNRSRDAVG